MRYPVEIGNRRRRHPGLHVFPVESFIFGAHRLVSRAADQEDGALRRRLVLDVETPLCLSVDGPRRGDDES